MRVFERDGYHVVHRDAPRPAPVGVGPVGPRDVHRMELGIVVRCADLVIVDAEATMGHFPHPECPSIEDSFSELIGLSVARGYTRAVQDRFGRERGCSHLEFLARCPRAGGDPVPHRCRRSPHGGREDAGGAATDARVACSG